MKVLDLFSGIGGFSHALDQITHNEEKFFETIAFCEMDPDATKVLNKHWPLVPVYPDISKLDGNELLNIHGPIQVLAGGFPCQDLSAAGKQRGLIDENGNATRSGLWFQYKRLIEEIRPKWVIIENVANLRAKGLGTVIQDLSEIGYDCSWEIISARSIGAPHLRERIWIVAYPHGGPVRDFSKRTETGRNDIQASWEAEFGNNGKARDARHSSILSPATDSESFGDRGDCRGIPSEIFEAVSEKQRQESQCGIEDSPMSLTSSYPHYFRFWRTFATEEEKSEWWSEATFSLRDWWEAVPSLRRMDDDVPRELYESERHRKARIKQLGNSIVPGIARLIGERIKYHECNEESQL